MVAATNQGDIYHGCFEVDPWAKTIQAFVPLTKVIDGKSLGYSAVLDLKIIKRDTKDKGVQYTVLATTHSQLYQFTDDCRLEKIFDRYKKSEKLFEKHSIKLYT